MSCTFITGNSSYQYTEPIDSHEAIKNLKLSISGLDVALNYMKGRQEKFEQSKKQGFASVDDFFEYERCQRLMKDIEERREKAKSEM